MWIFESLLSSLDLNVHHAHCEKFSPHVVGAFLIYQLIGKSFGYNVLPSILDKTLGNLDPVKKKWKTSFTRCRVDH